MPLDRWYGIQKGSDLKKHFVDPPREFSLLPFWAWNDTLDEDKLRFQINEMLDKGVYGAFLHARSGIEGSETPYFSEGWWNAVKAVVEYGAGKGFFTALYDEDKWPSGSAGGRVVSSNREYSKRGLKVEKWEISGPRSLTLDFSGDNVAILAGRLISQQSLDPSSILDLTDMVDQDWQVPEGQWSVMCFSELLDAGIQIDYLNRETVAKFIQITHEEYFRRFGTYFGTAIPGIFFDEIYANFKEAELVWSRDFLREFEKRKGYDLKPYLPYLLYHTGEETPRIRCDYFDVFTTLYTEAWFEQIADWCEDHKIWMTGHTLETIRDYQNQGSYFTTWMPVQIPGTDNEDYRYSFPRRARWYKAKQLSSLVHIKGKKRAMVEALGGGGWVVPLYEYKIGLALLGVYGLNMFIPHLFHYSVEKPECMDDWPPSWFYRNPYWKYFKKLADFGRRVSFMGTIGSHVCDVCLLFPITSLWADGMGEKEDVGTLGGGETGDILETQYNAVQEILIDNMIDYDVIDPEAVIRSKVSGRRLRVADEHYSVLILPPLTTIKRNVASKIRTFFDNGGTVVALNQLPKSSMEKGEDDGYVMNIFKHIFGFDPRTVRTGYLETDRIYEQEYTVRTSAKGGKAYFTKWVKHIPQILSNCIEKDVKVIRGDGSGLRILHRRVAAGESYFLVNEKKLSKEITLSFRDGGKPEQWDPETGEIKPITNYSWVNGRLTIPLLFKPWDAYYIVCTPTDNRVPKVMLSQTNLQDPTILKCKGSKIVLRGWRRGDVPIIRLELERMRDGNREAIVKQVELDDCMELIRLDGKWDFIPAPGVLDNQWKSGISSSTVELPVMRFRPERDGDNGEVLGWAHPDFDSSDWKQIKIKDTYSPHKACKRYLSSWDGAWINYYRYDRHWGAIGGKVVSFRRKLNLEKDVASGWVCIAADKSYTLCLNQELVGSGSNWKDSQVHHITSRLKRGENVFYIRVEQCQGLLLQGEIKFTDGSKVRLISDHQWETSVDDGVWYPAFPYIYPPLGPWGEVPMSGTQVTFPVALWYRQSLPVGAKALKRPAISGEYKMFVNGQEVGFSTGRDEVDISAHMREGTNLLAIKVVAGGHDDGILEPLPVVCGTGAVSLASWTEQGLSWYSGRAIYSREFDLPDSYLNPEIKLILELGEVRYCAEIWVNDELVTYRPWPPFSADITSYVRVGKNKVSIVMANLLANRRQWDIYDQNLTDLRSRFNHEGAVLRESDCLKSGLLGPVQIVPYYHETLEERLES